MSSIDQMHAKPATKQSKTIVLFGFIAAVVAIFITWIAITEIIPSVITPKSHRAQKEIHKFLDEKNLNSVAKLTSYSCTGPLPFVEDQCAGDIRVETDDFSKLEIVQKFVGERGDLRVDYIYKDVTFSSGARSTRAAIENIQPWISSKSDMTNPVISEGKDKEGSRITVNYDSDYSFNESCGIGKEALKLGYDTVYVYPGKGSPTYRRWAIDGLKQERAGGDFDKACSAITKFFDDDAGKYARITLQVMGNMSTDEMGILISADSDSYDKVKARAWTGWYSLPSTIQVRSSRA